MSASPPKEAEVEQGDPTPENSEHMDRGDDAQARDLAYNEFDVKEQDRWLPIANGSSNPYIQVHIHTYTRASRPHVPCAKRVDSPRLGLRGPSSTSDTSKYQSVFLCQSSRPARSHSGRSATRYGAQISF